MLPSATPLPFVPLPACPPASPLPVAVAPVIALAPLSPTAHSAAETHLVARLLARDERALRQLYEQYGRNLLTVIRRLVHEEALAQEMLQEGLLKVWLSIASYAPERGRLFTWMVRVCCNQAIDALRNPRHRFHSRNPSLDLPSVQQAPAQPSFNPEHIGVRELLLHLKPRQREVIDLLYFGGCTQAETAEQLGIPLATVKTRARAALQVLARVAGAGSRPGQPSSGAFSRVNASKS